MAYLPTCESRQPALPPQGLQVAGQAYRLAQAWEGLQDVYGPPWAPFRSGGLKHIFLGDTREIDGVSRRTLVAQFDPAPGYFWDWAGLCVFFRRCMSTPLSPCHVYPQDGRTWQAWAGVG